MGRTRTFVCACVRACVRVTRRGVDLSEVERGNISDVERGDLSDVESGNISNVEGGGGGGGRTSVQ